MAVAEPSLDETIDKISAYNQAAKAQAKKESKRSRKSRSDAGKKTNAKPAFRPWVLISILIILAGITWGGINLVLRSDFLRNDNNQPGNSVMQENSSSTLEVSETETVLAVTHLTDAPKYTATIEVTPIITITSQPTLDMESAQVNIKDHAPIVFVPAGEFVMGSEDEDADYDEAPEHTVYLDAFWINKYEINNAQYRLCIESGACFGDLSDYPTDDYPAIYITWTEATNYCEWAGGRLPTEAEWEKAARGDDGRIFPWGNGKASCSLAQYIDCGGNTVPVGSHMAGASPYGAFNMAGNVWEWVADLYVDYYYYNFSDTVAQNPKGPGYGDFRVIRGGSWYDYVVEGKVMRVTNRNWHDPFGQNNLIGFRCVFNATDKENK